MVVPVHVPLLGLKRIPVLLIRPEHPFHFTIALRVLDPAEDLLDAVGIQECLEPAITTIVAGELRTMITDALPN